MCRYSGVVAAELDRLIFAQGLNPAIPGASITPLPSAFARSVTQQPLEGEVGTAGQPFARTEKVAPEGLRRLAKGAGR